MHHYADSIPASPKTEWESLEDHANAVARRAHSFASSFGGQDIANLLGLVHDLGKVKARFQAKLDGEINNEQHSGEGARLLQMRYHGLGLLLGACVAGHHSGFPDIDALKERMNATPDVPLPDWLVLPSGVGPLTICMPGRPDQRPRPGSGNGWSSTITSAHTLPLAGNHLPWSIGRETKPTTPISRGKE